MFKKVSVFFLAAAMATVAHAVEFQMTVPASPDLLQHSCTAQRYGDGIYLTATVQEDVLRTATLYTSPKTDIAVTTSMQETMRLLERYCPKELRKYRPPKKTTKSPH